MTNREERNNIYTVTIMQTFSVTWLKIRVQGDQKEIKPVNPKGNQSWIFTGRTDTEAEASILWSPNEKNWLTGKDPDAGKDWRQEEKGTRENAMVGWHHRLDGHEFEQAPGISDEQEILACCSPWGCKELDLTEQLKWTEKANGSPSCRISWKQLQTPLS